MKEWNAAPLRLLRVGALACLPLLGGCAAQFTESSRSPPRIDVPEPGAGPAAPAQPRSASGYPAPGTAHPAARPATVPATSAYPSTSPPPGVQTAPAVDLPLPAPSAAGSEDSFTIESADGTGVPGAMPPVAGAPAATVQDPQPIELQTPPASANAAVNTLLAQAATERRGGNLDAAIAAAERALRIAPADPAVYCELATLRLERGDYALAEQLARKGLSHQPDAELQQRLGAIIARAQRGKTG